MELVIEDQDVADLAHELARKRGCTVDELLRLALERERDRLDAERRAKLEAIQERVRASWNGEGSDHSFLYDADGSPIL
jgi:hypothetical protein